jgi:thiamine kinase-like enzyme
LQDEYWDVKDKSDTGYTFEKSLKGRIDRGAYLCDNELEAHYNKFLSAYQNIPRTLCHDDLLPFNILVSDDGATIIDWEYAGMLPYLTSIARLIAHCEESDDAFFYMKDEDKRFAIDYYYDNLIKQKGIAYENYRHDLDLFLFYEYCEWIMLGNKYPDSADMERYKSYLEKTKRHLKGS